MQTALKLLTRPEVEERPRSLPSIVPVMLNESEQTVKREQEAARKKALEQRKREIERYQHD